MLDNYSTDKLQEEITRRLKAVINDSKPQQLPSKNFDNLIAMCQDYLDQATDKGWIDDELKQYIFESAMNAVFGNDVWAFINSRIR